MITRNKLIIKVIIDLLCMFLVFLPWIVLQTGIKPFQRGFFCNDQSLMHPYHDTTISSTIVIIVGISINVIVFLATEAVLKFIYHDKQSKYLRVRHGYSEMDIHPYIVDCYKVTGVFLFGAAFQQSVVNVLKYSVGRLRPHFFDICQPNWGEFQCKDDRGYYVYVTDAICTGTNSHRVHEARLSFPSGHSSLSFYFAVFFVLYVQVKWRWKFSKLITHLCQVIALFAALAVCVSRISDYKHHWSDVLAGALLGSSVSYIMARYNSGLYKHLSAKKFCKNITAISKKYSDYGTYSSNTHGEVNTICNNGHYDNIPGETKETNPAAKQFADSV